MLLKDLIKIPGGELQFLHKDKIEWSLGWCEGRNKLREEIGNISVEVDGKKIYNLMLDFEWKSDKSVTTLKDYTHSIMENLKPLAQHLADHIRDIMDF